MLCKPGSHDEQKAYIARILPNIRGKVMTDAGDHHSQIPIRNIHDEGMWLCRMMTP